MADGNGFDQYKHLITFRLNELDDRTARLDAEVKAVDKRVIKLETRVAGYAAIAGALVAGIIKLAEVFLKGN